MPPGVEPRFLWRWFLGWTLLSCVLIFAALKILTGMKPPEPFIIQQFKAVDFGRIVLLTLIAATLVFVAYFLLVATLPKVGPYTRPAGRWLVVALVLVIGMTALLVAGSLAPDRLVALAHEMNAGALSHEALATALVLSLKH
jgi:hypothetical protein